MIAAILISVLAFLANTTVHAKTGIIVPLYSYPETSSTWAPLRTAITTYPAVQFYVIVNPDSGPEGAPGSQPDTSYRAAVTSLRGHANVLILGYVFTSYGSRAQAAVAQDVQAYAGWTAAWGVDGIFFDETQAGLMATYQAYTDTVRAAKWTSGTTGYIVLNPGEDVGASTYYSIANQIVTFEDTYVQYQRQAPIPLAHAAQQSVIIHTFSNTTATLSSVIQTLETAGIASVYITNLDTDVYDGFGSDWAAFAQDVNSL
ncbi:Spherulation-specific family 4 [Mycena sp. CBHHK59/15]|nr:Spherulation-specific family 4 [Mycena sp. CBHHK59/15]